MPPRVILHNSISVDGRVDFPLDMGLHYGVLQGLSFQAHLTGSGTILAAPLEGPDDAPEDMVPGETDGEEPGARGANAREHTAQEQGAREPGAREASAREQSAHEQDAQGPGGLLVVADGRGRVRRWMALRLAGLWRRFVALVCENTPRQYLDHLSSRGIGWIEAGRERVDLAEALVALGQDYQVETVLLDSGGSLNSAMFREELVDEVSLLLHPCVVGHGTSLVDEDANRSASLVASLALRSWEKMGEDVLWLRYDVGR